MRKKENSVKESWARQRKNDNIKEQREEENTGSTEEKEKEVRKKVKGELNFKILGKLDY